MRVAVLALFVLAAPDWSAWAPLDTVTVITNREDGSPRETTVWIAVLEGEAYLRTGNTRWGREVQRDPEIAVEREGERRAVRAVVVTDEETRAAVVRAFEEKYGWGLGRLVNAIRGRDPLILRLLPRGP